MSTCADPSTTTSHFLDEKAREQNHPKEDSMLIEAWEANSGNAQMLGLSFDERLGMLVDAQHLSVHNKRIHRARKEAKLRLHTATVEAVEISESRNLSRAQLTQLSSCQYIEQNLEAQSRDVLEVLEDREGRRSTVVSSQLPVEHWHKWLCEPTVADAILDRLVHRSYRLVLKGPSRRKGIEPQNHNP